MTVDGIEINTICVPGQSSNGVNPQFTPIVSHGTPPYTYLWVPIDNNSTTLDYNNIAQPTVNGLIGTTGPYFANYRLTVYDASPVQKVASRVIKVQLKTGGYDLASRDAYDDRLNEPNQMILINGNWQIWASPDLWNRQLQDGVTDHQNPEYFTSKPNYAYVRVSNVGCASSPVSDVRLYWTKASTGEYWKDDWDGTTQVAGINNTLVPGGGEITAGSPISIPVLAPGQSVILNHAWYPPQPESFYGSPSTVDACLLARIEDSHGFTIPELLNQTVKYNVRNNNNIVTRNMIITNLNKFDRLVSHQADIANAEPGQHAFNIQLINDKTLNPSLSGDFSAVGHIEVALGGLYDKWVAGGRQGTVAYDNEATKTVTFDGTTTLELDNITLASHERYPVTVSFVMGDSVQGINHSFLFHLRQFMADSDKSNADVYGNVSFQVNVSDSVNNGAMQRRANPAGVASVSSGAGHYVVFPNPAQDVVNISNITGKDAKAEITVVNTLGQKMIGLGSSVLAVAAPTTIPVHSLTPGVYFITIDDGTGKPERFPFIKK